MRSLFLLAAIASLANAQTRTITGRVTDDAGQPVADATIAYTGDDVTRYVTDLEGRFTVMANGPAVVIRKQGYQSQFIRLDGSTSIQTVLHPEPVRPFPLCPGTTARAPLAGTYFDFQFSVSKEVVPDSKGADVDYSYLRYRAKTTRSSSRIVHVTGAMWGGGTPWELEVWNSVRYEESIYRLGDNVITAARGEDAKGKRWRYLGWFSEEISYKEADPKTADVFDKFLDGVCLARNLF